MREVAYNLAIETASRAGMIALGHGDELLATAALPVSRRHNIELTPAMDRLCAEHGVTPNQLGEVYVSLGPGSFTGLRIALATVKMLALAGGVKVVGVPTIEALRQQHPDAMVCLNVKRGSAWSAGPGYEPALRTINAVLATGLPIVGEAIEGVPRPVFNVEYVWRLGREQANAKRFDDPTNLSPLYIREPEAVTLWRNKEQENKRSREQESKA